MSNNDIYKAALAANGCINVTITRRIELTVQDIDDIMCSALEGGITYWCNKAEVIEEKRVADWGHEQIARGGILLLHDAEDGSVAELTLAKFVNGFRLWVENGDDEYGAVAADGTVDCCNIDGDMADRIVQYALFGEVQFG